VVVNSEGVAKDLFDGRSSIYSDKPQSTRNLYLDVLSVDHEGVVRFATDLCRMEIGDR
jgi:hypothetical protein